MISSSGDDEVMVAENGLLARVKRDRRSINKALAAADVVAKVDVVKKPHNMISAAMRAVLA